MVFRVEADKSADGGDGKGTVFEVLDGNVDANGIEKAHGGLSKLALEEMIERRFADTAFFCKVGHRKVGVPVSRYVFDGGLKCFVENHVRLYHLGQYALEHLVEQRVSFKLLKVVHGQKLAYFYQILLGLAVTAYRLRLVAPAVVMDETADVKHLDVGRPLPLGIAVYIFRDKKEVRLSEFFARLARAGQEIYLSKIHLEFPVGELLRLYDSEGFFAVGEVRDFEGGVAIKPIRQF